MRQDRVARWTTHGCLRHMYVALGNMLTLWATNCNSRTTGHLEVWNGSEEDEARTASLCYAPPCVNKTGSISTAWPWIQQLSLMWLEGGYWKSWREPGGHILSTMQPILSPFILGGPFSLSHCLTGMLKATSLTSHTSPNQSFRLWVMQSIPSTM